MNQIKYFCAKDDSLPYNWFHKISNFVSICKFNYYQGKLIENWMGMFSGQSEHLKLTVLISLNKKNSILIIWMLKIIKWEEIEIVSPSKD